MSRRRAIDERYRANPYAGTVSIGEAANSDMRDKDMVNLLYDGGFLAAEALEARLRAETRREGRAHRRSQAMYGTGAAGAPSVGRSFVPSRPPVRSSEAAICPHI